MNHAVRKPVIWSFSYESETDEKFDKVIDMIMKHFTMVTENVRTPHQIITIKSVLFSSAFFAISLTVCNTSSANEISMFFRHSDIADYFCGCKFFQFSPKKVFRNFL